MRKCLLVLVLLTSVAQAAPVIGISPSTIGFGGPAPNGGGPIGRKQFGFFTVQNTGDAQLVISDMTITGPASMVFEDGTCTTQTCTGPFTIDPGNQRGWLVTCTPAMAGYLSGSLAITSNAGGGTSTATLSCIGNNPPIIQVAPTALDFGISHSCNVGDVCGPTCATQPLTQTLTITNGAADPSDLTFYIAPPLPSSTIFDEWVIVDDCRQALPCSLGPGQSRVVQYTFRPHGGQPQLYTTPLAITPNYPGVPPVSVPFSAEGGFGLLAFDTPSNLGSAPPGQTITKSFTVRNSGRSCLTFKPPEPFDPDIVLVGAQPNSIVLASGATHTFTLQCTPPASGLMTFDLSFENSDFVSRNVFCTSLAASVAPTSHGFGTTAHPSWPSQAFSLVNAGSGDLTVEGITSAGDFAVGNLPIPTTVPGSTTHPFTITPTPRSLGELADTITIALDGLPDLAIPVDTLATDPALVVTPATYRLAHGDIDVDVGHDANVTLQNTTANAITISTCAIAGDPELSITTACPFTIAANSTKNLVVRFAPIGEAASSAVITLTGTGFATGTLRVRTSGTGIDQNVSLSTLDSIFGDTVRRPVEPPTRTVMIQNTDATRTLTLTTLVVDNPSFALVGAVAPIVLAPGASHTFTLRFTPTAYGDVTGHFTIGNADDPMIARVALSGRGVARPVEVDPVAIDLGALTVGGTTRGTISLSNTSSSSTIAISNVELDGAAFSLVGPTLTSLAPSDTTTLDVEFTPTAAGTYTATIRVFLDGDPDAHAEIMVVARGLEEGGGGGGCCSSNGGPGSLVVGLLVALVLGRRRRFRV